MAAAHLQHGGTPHNWHDRLAKPQRAARPGSTVRIDDPCRWAQVDTHKARVRPPAGRRVASQSGCKAEFEEKVTGRQCTGLRVRGVTRHLVDDGCDVGLWRRRVVGEAQELVQKALHNMHSL